MENKYRFQMSTAKSDLNAFSIPLPFSLWLAAGEVAITPCG
jgi:hypothetical protein